MSDLPSSLLDTTQKLLKRPADVLLIVPPYSQVTIQSLGIHNLQACARRAGFTVRVFYASLFLAAYQGEKYADVCHINHFLLGERLFAKAAWGDEVPEPSFQECFDYAPLYGASFDPLIFYPAQRRWEVAELEEMERECRLWTEALAGLLEELPYKVVGITSSYEQTNAAVAILKRIKERNPHIVTQMGGFNCEQDCARGIASLDPEGRFLDFVASGEGEESFVAFLQAIREGRPPRERIVKGRPLMNLDGIPPLDYSEYFEQLGLYLPGLAADKGALNIALETSRGCWWGEKHQCRFCGYDERIRFREKSSRRFLEELDEMRRWEIPSAHMADLIMPTTFFETLLPELARGDGFWNFYYEEKTAMDRRQMALLREAGVRDIQPGVESLSSDVLRRMGKGSSLRRNLRFLRDALAEQLDVYWNVVWGVPGESRFEYEGMNALLPLISHLTPPIGVFFLTLVKFSPYFREPEKYGLKDIRPNPSYARVYPPWTDWESIAMVYFCRYDADTREDQGQIDRLTEQIALWHGRWQNPLTRPRLELFKERDGAFYLVDTRGLEGTRGKTRLTPAQCRVLLDWEVYRGTPEQEWALACRAALREGKQILSLAVVPSSLRRELSAVSEGSPAEAQR